MLQALIYGSFRRCGTEALATTAPQIFCTNHGSQVAIQAWIGALDGRGVPESMKGKGRWLNKAFIVRPWRLVKHKGVCLWTYEYPTLG